MSEATPNAATGGGTRFQFRPGKPILSQNDADNGVTENALLMGAYEGLLTSLDGRGAYMTPAEVAAWNQPQPTNLAGTGMSVVKAGSIVQVVAVAPGSPAEGAGIKSGDQLRRVDTIDPFEHLHQTAVDDSEVDDRDDPRVIERAGDACLIDEALA